MKILKTSFFVMIAILAGCRPQLQNAVYVFAASSTAPAIEELAEQFKQETGTLVVVNQGASSTLARQIVSGAPCDVFLFANPEWFSYLGDNGIRPTETEDLLTNRLVVVARAGAVKPGGNVNIEDCLLMVRGHIAVGDPAHVPLGMYTRQALLKLDCFDSCADRFVYGHSARSVLRLVEYGEVPLAIVYRSDAISSGKVLILSELPEVAHAPIIYPLGLMEGSSESASQFCDFLKRPEASSVFLKHNFISLSSKTTIADRNR